MSYFRVATARLAAIGRLRRTRRIGIGLATTLVIYALFGFFGVPMILRHALTTQVAAILKRPIAVGEIAFNPFSLRLNVDQFHLGEPNSPGPFVDLGHLQVKLSWTSLLRLAPVVAEANFQAPAAHLVRTAPNRFNFSDLVEPTPGAPPKQPSSKPARFAVSNIQISGGAIYFDDEVLAQKHTIDRIELNVPFVANLPKDVNIYVQPLLEMAIDGSPVKIAGKARPFNSEPESEITLNLRALDLSQYLGYVPRKLPIKLPQGTLSTLLLIHFVQARAGPSVRIGGKVRLDRIDLRDAANSPLVGLNHAVVGIDDIEPFQQIVHLGSIKVDGLDSYLVLNRDGTNNLTPIIGASAARAPSPPASANAAAMPPAPSTSPVRSSAPSPPPSPAQAAQTTPAPRMTSTPTATPSAKASSAAQSSPALAAGPAPVPSAVPPGAPASFAAASPSATPPVAATPALSLPSLMRTAPSVSPPSGAAAAQPANSRLLVTLNSFELTDSTVHLTDNSNAVAAAVVLQALHASLTAFKMGEPAPPAPFDLGVTLGGGGTLGVKGALDLAQSQAAAEVTVEEVDVPALQRFAQPALAANIAAGKLSARASLRVQFAPGKFNIHAEPAKVSLDKFDLEAPDSKERPVQWNTISANIAQADLAAHQATVNEVRTEAIHLFVRRAANGQLNLMSFVHKPGEAQPAGGIAANQDERVGGQRSRSARRAERRPVSPPLARRIAARRESKSAPPTAPPPRPVWQYNIASVALEKTEINLEDEAAARPVKLALAPLNVHLKDITSDLSKPFPVELDGTVNRHGTFKVDGTAAIAPLEAKLKIATRQLDVSMADAYVSSGLNAKIATALLTMTGEAGVSNAHDELRASYRGGVTVGNVKLMDKLTNDLFMRWYGLNFERIDFKLGEGPPKVHVGAISLNDFYARLILDADGHLNLRDITAKPQEAPTSLTRENLHGTEPAPGPPAAPIATPTPSPTPTPAASTPPVPAPQPKPINADIAIGHIILARGNINYTDDFIKPNYSANLTDVAGKIGGFGSHSTEPADVALEGQVNGSAPINIDGSINPLAPMASVDIGAKAKGIELTDLTAYSAKYTGYPITKGTLSVDVHYLLDQDKLTAQNHIFIDQLTFGDKVPQPSVLNLPIRLAVAILKDAQGRINLDIPVSGSLSDPQFSIGSVIWHTFVNVIMKVVASPFRLLASALPGGGSGAEGLAYIEFAPGYSKLTDEDRKKLDTVVAALGNRESLKLGIAGRVDPPLDRPGLRDAKVDELVRKEKIESMGEEASANPEAVEVSPDEYDKYLKRAYKAATFAKPKDFLGLNKSLPADEMKKLLVTNMEVSDKDLAALADARAKAVRSYLSAKFDPSRLFIVAPRLDASGIEDKGKTTRADLSVQ